MCLHVCSYSCTISVLVGCVITQDKCNIKPLKVQKSVDGCSSSCKPRHILIGLRSDSRRPALIGLLFVTKIAGGDKVI